MAAEKKFGIGDLVEVQHRTGKVSCRVSGGRLSHFGHLYLVTPCKDVVMSDVVGTELDHFDLPSATVDWGLVPPKPWWMLPLHMIVDPFTTDLKIYFKKQGLCPQCGDPGYWKIMACICPYHGPFLGV